MLGALWKVYTKHFMLDLFFFFGCWHYHDELTLFVQGDIDNIAPLITSFFCMSYALCNLTAFALSVTGAPNFRPTWKYYSWQLALLGFIMNIGT